MRGRIITMIILVTLLFRKVIETTERMEPFELVSCHYIQSPDSDLPVIDEDFDPPERSIFFHETSCKGGLNSRQKCAVESAAKQNPAWKIYVFFSGDVPDYAMPEGNLSTLLMIPNVNIYRLRILDYAKNTPLEDFMRSGPLNNSRYSILHTSDVLRFLTLYKYGGVYLDLDVIVVRPLDSLEWNYAAMEPYWTVIANGVLSFAWDKVGWEVAVATIRDVASKYNGTIMIQNGPSAITRVLKKRCNTTILRHMTRKPCQGFKVYDSQYFYPISYSYAERYFKPGPLERGVEYTHHVWNRKTSDLKVHRKSPYAKLAREFCPETYKLYDRDFGTFRAIDNMTNNYITNNHYVNQRDPTWPIFTFDHPAKPVRDYEGQEATDYQGLPKTDNGF